MISNPNDTIQKKPKLKYVLYFIPVSEWCILLLAREFGLTQPGCIFSPIQNLLRKRVCDSKNKNKKHALVFSLPGFEGLHLL
jgi:hypothetical protein